MSLVHVANFCSHLQNASKARLGLTSVPSTNLLLALTLSLQQSGFLSAVVRGGPNPPAMLTASAMPHATQEADIAEATVTQANVASRRLWLGLKYWNNDPVLSALQLESRPTQRVRLGFRDLAKIVRGQDAAYVKGLRRPGECLFVSTDKGIMEARDAVDKRMGGLVLCRAR